MSLQTEKTGNVYDLGYRTYKGERLGRGHAAFALYFTSLRGIFGLGRHTSSKILPWLLAGAALVPATIYLGIATIAKAADFQLWNPVEYFGLLFMVLALFVAAVAPELIGRDQKNHTLPLLFSRKLTRADYVLAKFGALATALFAMALVPQIVVFFGSSLVGSDSIGYLKDNWRDLVRIFACAAMLAGFWSSVALAIGSQTDRWQMASGGILAYFVISAALAELLMAAGAESVLRYPVWLSGFHVIEGFTRWIFDQPPVDDGALRRAGFALWTYGAAGVALSLAALAFTYRRYRRMAL